MRALLERAYWKAERTIVPGLGSSQYAYYEKLRKLLYPECRWLDMGCGHDILPDWMPEQQKVILRKSGTIFGIDLDLDGLRKNTVIKNRVLGTLEQMPFQDASFDVVSANMVVEHLEQPATVLREVRRTLKPNGLLMLHTPNYYFWLIRLGSMCPEWIKKFAARFLEGRREEDVFKTYYRMNTRKSLEKLAKEGGFRVTEMAFVSTSAALIMLGPLVLLELLYIRLLQRENLAEWRSNLIVTLQKE